jgi:hypothetical protein
MKGAIHQARPRLPTCSLFARLISHQPAVLFSQNKQATSNQPAVLFSQNKPAPAISHQPTEHGDDPVISCSSPWPHLTHTKGQSQSKPPPTQVETPPIPVRV